MSDDEKQAGNVEETASPQESSPQDAKKKMSFKDKAKAFGSKIGKNVKKAASNAKDMLKDVATIDVEFEGEGRKTGSVIFDAESRRRKELPIFSSDEPLAGKVVIKLKDGKKLEHTGIRMVLIGRIEMYYERIDYELIRWERELSPEGILSSDSEFEFETKQFDKEYESYYGTNVRLRYYLRVSIGRPFNSISKEFDLYVQTLRTVPERNPNIVMEVGIEDCLHIQFNYDKSKFYLHEAITGTIEFKLVRLRVNVMEMSIIRKESTGLGPTAYTESETLAKYELMDGIPVKAEKVPIRWYMSGVELTPTFRNVNNKFGVRYFINLILIDEQDRKYFKQQEIEFYRDSIGYNDTSFYIMPKRLA